MKPIIKVLLIGLILSSSVVKSQSVGFALKTSPHVGFDFNTISEFETGIINTNVATLNIEAAGTDWDLYVGATTTVPGMWDVTSTYSIGGIAPPVSLMQVRVRNTSNTSLVGGFFSLQDISTPTYIIGSAAADASLVCPAVGTNVAGSYLTSPNCYLFTIDLKLVPGFVYQLGLYTIRIDYVIIQDL